MDYTAYILSLPVSQFKAIKRAIASLVRFGIPYNDALFIIMQAHTNQIGMRRDARAHEAIRSQGHKL